MFSNLEKRKLEKLVDTELVPEDVLDTDEKSVVTNISLIRDSLFLPKHNKEIQTIRLKKLVTADFDLKSVIERLGKILSAPFELRIGLSFIAENATNDLIYFFAIRDRPINHDLRIIRNKSDLQSLKDFAAKFTYSDLLNFTFEQSNNLNAFDQSGFRPRKLVLGVFWVSKYTDFHDDNEKSDDDDVGNESDEEFNDDEELYYYG